MSVLSESARGLAHSKTLARGPVATSYFATAVATQKGRPWRTWRKALVASRRTSGLLSSMAKIKAEIAFVSVWANRPREKTTFRRTDASPLEDFMIKLGTNCLSLLLRVPRAL